MFVLNKDVVESILNSNSFSNDFKDLMMNYVDRELSESEINDFISALFNTIMDNRRIKENLFDSMLSNDRANRLNTMLEGIRRSNRNNTLTNSELSYIRDTLLRNFIVDDAPSMNRNNSTTNTTSTENTQTTTQSDARARINRNNITDFDALTREFNRLKEELDVQGLSIGITRLNEILEDLNLLNQINQELQEQVRLDNNIDYNELRDTLVNGYDIWKNIASETDRTSQMIDIKGRVLESKNEQISREETHRLELQTLLGISRAHLSALQDQFSRVTDEDERTRLETFISQAQAEITTTQSLVRDRETNLENLRREIEQLNSGGYLSELDNAVIVDRGIDLSNFNSAETSILLEEYDEVLARINGRDLSIIGLEELMSIRRDLDAVHNLNQDLQNRNRFNANIDINELRNTLVRGEELWNSVGSQIISIDSEIETKNNLLSNYNKEIEENNEKIKKQEELIENLKSQITALEEAMNKITDLKVLEAYQKSLDTLRESLNSQQELLDQLKELINELNKKVEIVNKGGELDSRNLEDENRLDDTNTRSLIDNNLSAEEQLSLLRSKYEELMSRLNGRDIDEIGTIELKQINKEFVILSNDIHQFNDDVRFNKFSSSVDNIKALELMNEADKLDEDIRVGMISPYEKYNEKLAILKELLEKKKQIKISIKSVERIINNRTADLEKIKKDLESISDPEVRKVYEQTISSIESEIEGYKNQLNEYNEELERIDKLMDIIRKGGPYKDLLNNKKPKREDEKKKPENKDDEKEKPENKDNDSELTPPPGPERKKPNGLPADVTKHPNVKYNKPKLTWKTALAVAAGVGIGATVFFTTGPTGVAVMSIVSGVANKFVNSARAKAAANRMNILGEEVKVEEVEEPKRGIKGAVDRFKKYIKSEEGLRDISWMLTSAIITGNALSVGSAIRSKIIANQASNVTPKPGVEPAQSTQPVQPAAETAQVTTPTPTPTVSTPSATNPSVYDGIRLGDNVGNYNVSVGHRQATKAFGGLDTLNLNQNLVNSDSVFSEFAIVDDSGKLIQRISTPGLSLDEVCAQYGVNYSNVVLDVAKNGTPQAWINVEELINGVSMGGPTV